MHNFKNLHFSFGNFFLSSGLEQYIEKIIQNCREKGYVTTLSKRRRYLPEINNSNPGLRTEAERMAINTTIQGSAADLIKTSMINLREKFECFLSVN